MDSSRSTSRHSPTLSQARLAAAKRRDAALRRIGSTRRWVILAAAGLSAAFAALVSALAPGHSISSAHAATGHARTSTPAAGRDLDPAMPAPAGAGALGLGGGGGNGGGGNTGSGSSGGGSSSPAPAQSAPAPAPAPAPSPAPVTSGGS